MWRCVRATAIIGRSCRARPWRMVGSTTHVLRSCASCSTGPPLEAQQPLTKTPSKFSTVAGTSQPTSLQHLHEYHSVLKRILRSSTREDFHTSRRRVRGVVRSLEATPPSSWLAPPPGISMQEHRDSAADFLCALGASRRFLGRSRTNQRATPSTSNADDDGTWSAASPFFSTTVSDGLAVCFDLAVESARLPAALLHAAVELELPDSASLRNLIQMATSRQCCTSATPSELVELLRDVSLAAKRCRVELPGLDFILSPLPRAALSARESLTVLSALVRLKELRAPDVVAVVSRRAMVFAPHYSSRDLIYGLQASAYLDSCWDGYSAALLVRCERLAPSMTPQELGHVCKYVALLNHGRRNNRVARTCDAELRRALVAVVERAEELLGQFSFRDGRYVLRCLGQHKVKHAILVSQLMTMAEHT